MFVCIQITSVENQIHELRKSLIWFL